MSYDHSISWLSLLQFADELGNISKACQIMGYHRDSFYDEIKRAFQMGGTAALIEQRRGPLRRIPTACPRRSKTVQDTTYVLTDERVQLLELHRPRAIAAHTESRMKVPFGHLILPSFVSALGAAS